MYERLMHNAPFLLYMRKIFGILLQTIRTNGIFHNADTEIDWTSYMQQVSQYVSGERDYVHIKGATGPLVYPAAHLYIYSALYYVTDQGRDIALAQYLFGGLYLVVLSVVVACYRIARVCDSILLLLFSSPPASSLSSSPTTPKPLLR